MSFLSPAGTGRTAAMRRAGLQLLSLVEAEVNVRGDRDLQLLGRFSSPHVWSDIYFNPVKAPWQCFWPSSSTIIAVIPVLTRKHGTLLPVPYISLTGLVEEQRIFTWPFSYRFSIQPGFFQIWRKPPASHGSTCRPDRQRCSLRHTAT